MSERSQSASHPHGSRADTAHARFWRSIDDCAAPGQPANDSVASETAIATPWSRRAFIKLGAASLALAGVAGCSRTPLEKIVPYVDGPPQQTYGKPVYFGSAHTRDGYGTGTLVATHMGRPTKIEGNPLHPASLGGTDIFAQASILDLYDPDRSTVVRRGAAVETWPGFVAALQQRVRPLIPRGGEGLHVLTGTVTSPSLVRMLAAVQRTLPRARWHAWQPLTRDHAYTGTALAFGRPL
jgi:hypothetical protein